MRNKITYEAIKIISLVIFFFVMGIMVGYNFKCERLSTHAEFIVNDTTVVDRLPDIK